MWGEGERSNIAEHMLGAGRVVFGDKAGWINVLDADDGKLITELKIGENINSTPAILDGRIYIGAFNGKLYCLGMEPKAPDDGSQKAEGRKQKAASRRQRAVSSNIRRLAL